MGKAFGEWLKKKWKGWRGNSKKKPTKPNRSTTPKKPKISKWDFDGDVGYGELKLMRARKPKSVTKQGPKPPRKNPKGSSKTPGKPAGGGKKGGCKDSNSFEPGTLVLLADGSSKPIEDIAVGDQVAASDPESGDAGAKEVTATITGTGSKDLVKIVIDTPGKKDETLVATDGHPFWVVDPGAWRDAGR